MSKNLDILLRDLDVLEVLGNPKTPVRGIVYDSRQAGEGDLFVAMKGAKQDGARFIRDAVGRGACAVVAESAPENGDARVFVRVRDCRKALAGLADNFFDHPSRDLRMVGITGTNGKTTTTLLLEGVFQAEGQSVGVLGTLAYRWAGRARTASMTTPESLDLQRMFFEMRQERVSTVVMEVSSHALELGRVEGCFFDAAAFTNLSRDHLDFHPDMESYFVAKRRLFKEHLRGGGKSSVAVVNADDPYGRRLIQELGSGVWSYSMTEGKAAVSVKRAELSASGIRADLVTPAGSLELRSSLIGRLNLYNLLTAATTALALGVAPDIVARGLAGVSLVDGRLQRVPVPREAGFEVIVDYAHTPDAMEKSLGCLREMTQRRLLVVFGCGGDRDRGKRPLMGEVAARLGDLAIVTSDNPRSESPEAIIEEIEVGMTRSGFPKLGASGPSSAEKGYAVEADRKKAIELALSWAGPGDVVFIGGKGHETYQLIGGKTFPFDDRTVVMNRFDSKVKPNSAESPDR